MLKKCLALAFMIFSTFTQAEILEIEKIDEIRPYVTNEALCLFDIDDTLIDNPFSLGSLPWRDWARPHLAAIKSETPLFDALTFYIAKKAAYKSVEPATAPLIADLQAKEIAVLGFTARGRSLWYTSPKNAIDLFTHKQLTNVGIDFSQTKLPTPLNSLNPKYFYQGILFAQHLSKGELLKTLLKELDYTPSLLIFVDDRKEYVESVHAVALELGIPAFCFWYRQAELSSPSFDPHRANLQLEHLVKTGAILSDLEAQKMLSDRKSGLAIDEFHTILKKINFTD